MMIASKQVIQAHPAWILLFLAAYVAAYIVFVKTNGNIIAAALTLLTWMITSVTILYYAHGLL